MVRKILFIVLSVILVDDVYGQEKGTTMTSVVYIGVGAGPDHGGVGLKVEFLPAKRLGFFGGAGYNFEKLGLNAVYHGKHLQKVNQLRYSLPCMDTME